jgi:hypothetical protein
VSNRNLYISIRVMEMEMQFHDAIHFRQFKASKLTETGELVKIDVCKPFFDVIFYLKDEVSSLKCMMSRLLAIYSSLIEILT